MSDPHRPLKTAFSRYATGVTVVGCMTPEGAPVGLTVNSFTSVSLEPPLVLWCVDRASGLFDIYAGAEAYAVSVLREDAAETSTRFATPDRHVMAAGEHETKSTGAPLLRSRLAGFDCRVVGRHAAGDHMILVGEILDFDAADGKPLLYANSAYGALM
ncbi:MAG: flavin reductase family protein [Pseudomonadota bacterium]